MEHNLKKDIFSMFTYIKYILEGKASVPFDKEKNTEPYKCPISLLQETDETVLSYGQYDDSIDRKYFDQLEDNSDTPEWEVTQKEDEREKVILYHRKIRRCEKMTEAHMLLKRFRDGQVTITKSFYDQIFSTHKDNLGMLIKNGISIKEEMLSRVLTIEENLEKKWYSFWLKHKVIDLNERWKLTFQSNEASISIELLVYYANGEIEFISFIEGSIKSETGDPKDIYLKMRSILNNKSKSLHLTPLPYCFKELTIKEKEELIKKKKRRLLGH